MNQPKVLRVVTDRFNLFNDGRRLGANRRNYILAAVKQMIDSPETQELLRLGEAYGFYGHQPRQRAGKPNIGESEVIMVNGKPIIVENVPSNRTVSITVSDDGTIEHKEEVFDTPTGRIIHSLIASGVGGWSWVTGGREMAHAAITRTFHGMDYVLQPNYLSLDHPQMMLESVADRESMMLESLQNAGMSFDEAKGAIDYLNRNSYAYADMLMEKERENMFLEGVIAEKDEQLKQFAELNEQMKRKGDMLLEAVSALPFNLTDEQKTALVEMNDDHHVKVVQAMFESMTKPSNKLATLPMGYVPAEITKGARVQAGRNDLVSFEPRRLFS